MGDCQESTSKYTTPRAIAKSQLQNTQNHGRLPTVGTKIHKIMGDCQDSASKYAKPLVTAKSQPQNTQNRE
jgi:hypothetical protein